ncbi:MAG: CPBP family intramembrane metalloprotease [Lachnospiraceae bacterium]|nr:CPBP family intramembrane metalloprotease [Lachnospiraceae bacterium]
MLKDKKKTIVYLIWAFVIAWILQVIASAAANIAANTTGMTNSLGNLIFTGVLAVSMYAPFFAVLLAKYPLKGMGWIPKLKGNIGWMFLAWVGPLLFSVLGAVVYFVIFPERFDLTGAYFAMALGEEGLAQVEAEGLTLQQLLVMQIVSAPLYAPFINMFAALGEEVGWRGMLYPQLKSFFGKTKGRILGGAIWGAWHWPVMLLAGYEYGKAYPGAPISGMITFCLFCIVSGTLLDVLYEKTNCIWVPSLAHGAINGTASLAIYLTKPEYIDQMILGPAPIGIIGVIPALIVAVIVLCKDR